MIWILLAATHGRGSERAMFENASAAKIAVRRVVKLHLCIFLFSLKTRTGALHERPSQIETERGTRWRLKKSPGFATARCPKTVLPTDLAEFTGPIGEYAGKKPVIGQIGSGSVAAAVENGPPTVQRRLTRYSAELYIPKAC